MFAGLSAFLPFIILVIVAFVLSGGTLPSVV